MLSGMIAERIAQMNEVIWGPWMPALLLGTGVFLMLRLRFLPIRRLGFALRCAVGLEPERVRGCDKGRKGRENDKHTGEERRPGGVSPFASLMTELAATIGTGNIVGVATAMVLGGPGALLWMIVASLFGMATKLTESTLSVKYRKINAEGEWVGGPMYTLERGLPLVFGCRSGGKCRSRYRGREAAEPRYLGKRLGRALGLAYAFLAVMASFGMGNMTQSNSIAEAVKVTYGVPVEVTGLVLTVVTILVVLGGIRSIAKVTQVLVPFMGIFYLLGTTGVILAHIDRVPQGLAAIVVMAFAPGAVAGGLMGNLAATASLSMSRALRYGVSRGMFSNEAGLGAAGITAAAADTEDFIRQGYISMTGVFLDTCVICSMTGLALAASGLLGTIAPGGELLNGTELVIAVFAGTFGAKGAGFLCVSIVLFAYATIVAWAYQGEKAFEYLVGSGKYGVWYRFAYALAVFAGAVCSLEAVWNFSDLCNGLMAVPNLLCVLALSVGRHGICSEILAYSVDK